MILGGKPLIIHSCCRPSSGVNLFLGSHSKHRPMKFTKESSGASRNFYMIYFSLSSFWSSVKTSNGAGTALSLNYENNYFRYEFFKTC